MTRTPLAVIAISAAAINDVIGWLLLALITELVSIGTVRFVEELHAARGARGGLRDR